MNFINVRFVFLGVFLNLINLKLFEAAECFSCMSAIYEFTFNRLGHNVVYMKPLIYTDQCEDVSKYAKDIPRKECQSNCITIIETINWGYGGHGYIRGCYDHIFVHGFNHTGLISKMKFADYCGTFNLTTIMKRPPVNYQDTRVKFCSCKGHMCNGGSSKAAHFTFEKFSLILFAVSLLQIVIN